MPDHTEGVATETSPSPVDNSQSYENAFEAALREVGSQPEAMPGQHAQVQPPKQKEQAPAQTPAEEPKQSSEFPEEFITGEKPMPKEDAPHPDDADVEALKPSPKLGEEQRGNFQKLKDWTKEARAEARAAKAELEKLRKAPTESTEALTKAQERIAELEDTLERAHFQASPRYQQMGERAAAAITNAKGFLEGTEINPGIIDSAAQLTGAKRLAFMREAGMDAETISAVMPYLAEADRQFASQKEALSRSKELGESWQREEGERMRLTEDRIFRDVAEEISKDFEPLQMIPGNDAWNAKVQTAIAQAKEAFNGEKGVPHEEYSRLLLMGAAAKILHGLYRTVRDHNKALREQVGKLKAAQPSNGSTRPTGTPQRQGPMTEDERFNAAAEAFEAARAGR